MQESQLFTIRLSGPDRDIFKAVAKRLDRDESAMLRLVVRRVAEELGVSPVPQPTQTTDDRKAA